ncbi:MULTISPECIES: hypothetical protein [Nocardia]|uniref:hypothetical protein n=1 Tax=Nocardia TaxID=1817 RepID=UPI0013004C66|nr:MULTISPECIES: hypothetical protein [Nocardia]
MNVTPEKAAELLARVQATSERSRQVKAEADKMVSDAAEERGDAVAEALAAGIPRGLIAKAAEVHRNLLYRIAGRAGEE